MNNDCCARQVCISSTDQWGIRWSTALSQPDSVVDSSSYLAITNLKYKINANISIQGPSPSATIDEALVKVCCDWNNEALVKVLRSKCYNNCIFDLTAKELSDACSYSLYSFVLSQFCLVLLFVHAHHALCTLLASWLLCLFSLSATTVTTVWLKQPLQWHIHVFTVMHVHVWYVHHQ